MNWFAGFRLIETGHKFICTDLSMSFLAKLVHTPTTQSILANPQEKGEASSRSGKLKYYA